MVGKILRQVGVLVFVATALGGGVAARADVTQIAQAPAGPQLAQAPARLRPELQTVFDCRREMELMSTYWDRLSGVPGVRLERRFFDAAVRAFQSGNVEECWRAIGELRRHMGY